MKTKRCLKIRIYTAHDSLSVFRIDKTRVESALERHPDIDSYVKFSIYKTRSRYGGAPGWSDEDLVRFYDEISDADAMIGYSFPTDNLRARAPKMKWIHIIGAGIEHLNPLTWLPDGIALTNNRGAHAPKTCEFAMATILMLGNHIPRLASAQKEKRWDGHFVSIVEGSCLVVLGAGKQGSAVAKGGKRLGLKTIGVDIDLHEREYFDHIVPSEKLLDVLVSADFVAITLPLTTKTEGCFGVKELEAMKPEAGLFNISRGRILDTNALIKSLKSGAISGAVLDVFEEEPLPPNSPLWDTPNLIITPHMGCDDEKFYIDRTFDIVMNNARRMLNGERLKNLVDSSLGY